MTSNFTFGGILAGGAAAATVDLTSSDKVLKVLSNPGQESSDALLAAIKKVPQLLSSRALEVDALLSPMVRLVASHNAEVKALACDFLVQWASPEHPDVGLLAVNTLNGDLRDPNPAVRAVAVATICSLPDLAEQHSFDAISLALQDSNPGVRKSGVTACGKLFRHSPAVVEDRGVVDTLYRQLKDPDPTVLTFALQTLNVILEEEGGVVVNNNMARYFVRRIADFPDLELCFLFEYLQKYYCDRAEATDDARVDLLNALDPYLDSKKGPVFLSAASLFYSCARAMAADGDVVAVQFLDKVRPHLSKFLKSSSSPATQDFQTLLLDFILRVDRRFFSASSTAAAEQMLRDLLLKPKDLATLKVRKVQAIRHVCCQGSSSPTALKYLTEQLRVQEDAAVTEELLGAACALAAAGSNADHLVGELKTLLRLDPTRFSSPLLRHARLLPLKEDKSLLDGLCRSFLDRSATAAKEEDVRSFLWVLTNHLSPESPYFLEEALQQQDELFPPTLLQPLLLCAVRLFSAQPASSQHLLGTVFELCVLSGRPEMSNRVEFYSRLLQSPDLVRSVIANH